MRFRDRLDAGRHLAGTLRRAGLHEPPPVVLGLPRGGVPVAFEVAEGLGAPLDVLVVRKLGVPFQHELAMGAIGEGGVRVENDDVLRSTGLGGGDLDEAEQRERPELERRALSYRDGRPRLALTGRCAIIVDDGVATGSTARAACQVARALGAARIVVAIPVASRLAVSELERDCDRLVCLEAPEPFFAVGEWYRDFSQTSDDQVIELLRRVRGRPGTWQRRHGAAVTDSIALPDESSGLTGDLQLRRWTDPAIIVIACIALASGFGQYGAVAALGDVSKQLGHIAPGGTIANKVGLSGTSLGIGLAIIRLASLGSLPLIGIADRLGRRRVILFVTIVGLALTVVAAASPGYWWFVAIFAFGRPLLSATNALAEVMGAEDTGSSDRSAAVALIAAGYGVGAGLSAIVHSLAAGVLGFRGIFALAVVPLVGVYALRGRVEEPRRFTVAAAGAEHPIPVLGAVGPRYRRRVVVLAAIGFAISVVTGPASSFAFLYAQDVLHLAGWVTAAHGRCVRCRRPVGIGGRALAGRPGRPAAHRHGRTGGGRVHGRLRLHGLGECVRCRIHLGGAQRRPAGSSRGRNVGRVVPDVGQGIRHGMVGDLRRAGRRRRARRVWRRRGRRQPIRRGRRGHLPAHGGSCGAVLAAS